MRPDFQQRFQIYVVGPNQDGRLASVAPGQLITGVEFQFDPDAPFLMRGYCYRVSYDTLASRTQVGIQNVALRFSGPDQDFRSAQLIPQNLVVPYGGQSSAWKPLYPERFYPARSTMQLEFQNLSSSTTLTNLTFYFLGVKLFPWGTNPAYSYPAKARMTQYAYPINYMIPQSVGNPTGAIQNLLTADERLRQVIQIKPDADFVCRSFQAGPSYAPFGLEVFFQLRDENYKSFSNDYVHFEVLAGLSGGNYQTGASGSLGAVGTGNSLPGIIFPEWYIPKGHLGYYDVLRKDSGYVGAQTIPNFPFTLMGSRVWDAQ